MRTFAVNNDDFTDEMIFLITDSIIATQVARETDDPVIKEEQLYIAQDRLNEVQELVIEDTTSQNTIIFIIASLVVIVGIIIYIKKRKNLSDDEILARFKTNEEKQ